MTIIRVGILLDNMIMSAWAEKMLENIVKEEGVEIARVVKNIALAPKKSVFSKLVNFGNTFFILIWREIDRRLFSVKYNAFRKVDLSTILKDVPQINVVPAENSLLDYLCQSDIESIKQYGVTVFFQLGFKNLRGSILTVAPCGVWSFQHDDNLINRDGLGGFWEVLLGMPTTGSVLQVLNEEAGNGEVLYNSWSATDHYSIHRNLNKCYWKSISFMPRRLRELRRLGITTFMEKYAITKFDALFYKDYNFAKNNKSSSVVLIVKLAGRIVGRLLWRLQFREQWMLLYNVSNNRKISQSISGFSNLMPPTDRIWADPCVVEFEGQTAVFIEEMEFVNNIGYLSVIEFDLNDNPILPPKKIIQKPYHMSYPNVFESNDDLYMIPETQKNSTIELYRCTKFPYDWEFVKNLMENVRAVDSTIFYHDKKYWLFANMIENRGASTHDELFLFSSETLLGQDWRSHPQNPIVSDARCARPAGKIFQYDGIWYRPAQDCSDGYGKAINFQRIDLINEDEYCETTVSRIDANWDKDIMRTHTFSHAGRFTFIDGLQKRSKYFN